MPGKQTKRLLVEGDEDRRVVPEVIEANGIPWGDRPSDAIVWIEAYDGLPNLLSPDTIETELKASGLEALGLMVDANDDPAGRWRRIRDICSPRYPDFPKEIVPGGLVIVGADGIRLGVWLVPDNSGHGMLETFLGSLIDTADSLWPYAREATAEAKRRGAAFRPGHADKAAIHAWLAWQDPPGSQLHIAVMKRLFGGRTDAAASFVAWFRRLYAV